MSAWTLDGITVHVTQNGHTYALHFDGAVCDTMRDPVHPDEHVITLNTIRVAEALDVEDYYRGFNADDGT
jgi:hypothetical protein